MVRPSVRWQVYAYSSVVGTILDNLAKNIIDSRDSVTLGRKPSFLGRAMFVGIVVVVGFL